MLPMYERLNAPKTLFRISFGKVALAVVSLALGSFAFCIIWSLLYEFQRSTFTHCEVRNYLPSISSAIGSYEPQRTVWRAAICFQLPMRLYVAKMYFEYYQAIIRRNRRSYVTLACFLNVFENLALLALSMWTSADDYNIHRNAFITFIACSELYMCTSYFLNKNGRKAPMSEIEEKSLKYKRNLFIVNVGSFFLACYFFVRHNAHCEPGVYTFFALFEYIVVLTNIGYHATAYWDFYTFNVVFDWEKKLYLSQL